MDTEPEERQVPNGVLAMQRESAVVKRIKTWLKENGWVVWKNHGSAYSEVGLPDLMGVRGGVFLALEIKGPKGRTTAMQEKWVRDIRRAGGVAGVARSVEDVEEILREAD